MANLISFDVDLTVHEGTRLAAVLEAIGLYWDPAEIYAGETEAHRMLYSNLDAGQQSSYNLLIAHGVLPEVEGWST
ncbi:MAG TPA: DUF6400 family protein [Pseudonocardiaceae bacterium]|jgi:hypothetical protein